MTHPHLFDSMENNIANILGSISNKFNQYGSIVIFLFGVIGNLLNVIVLRKKELRQNPCAWLFLVASIVNILAIVSGLTTRMLSGWAVDPTATISWLCKLRTYVMVITRVIAPWLLVLAMFDRWLVSSSKVHFRRRSTLKNAQRGALVIILIPSLLFCHLFYCYEANLTNTPLRCYYRNYNCLLATDIMSFAMVMIIPTTINATFSLMTIRNIRRSHRRIGMRNAAASTNSSHEIIVQTSAAQNCVVIPTKRAKRRTDRDLMRMLLVQVLLLIIFTLPLVLEKIYSTIRPKKLPLEATIDSFVYNIALLSSYLTNGMPFYIYTVFGGDAIRKSLINLFRRH